MEPPFGADPASVAVAERNANSKAQLVPTFAPGFGQAALPSRPERAGFDRDRLRPRLCENAIGVVGDGVVTDLGDGGGELAARIEQFAEERAGKADNGSRGDGGGHRGSPNRLQALMASNQSANAPNAHHAL